MEPVRIFPFLPPSPPPPPRQVFFFFFSYPSRKVFSHKEVGMKQVGGGGGKKEKKRRRSQFLPPFSLSAKKRTENIFTSFEMRKVEGFIVLYFFVLLPIVIFLGPGMKNISIASLAADSPKSAREKNHLSIPCTTFSSTPTPTKIIIKSPHPRRRRREKSSPRPPSPPPSPPPFLSKHFRCRFVRGQLATSPSSEMCRAGGGNLEEGGPVRL